MIRGNNTRNKDIAIKLTMMMKTKGPFDFFQVGHILMSKVSQTKIQCQARHCSAENYNNLVPTTLFRTHAKKGGGGGKRTKLRLRDDEMLIKNRTLSKDLGWLGG